MSSLYLVALGSNRRHHLYGSPRQIVSTAMEELSALGTVARRAPVIDTAPMGGAKRRFANSACLIESEYDPPALLAGLKRMEQQFGRRRGQRWDDRVLDCDIILWSGGLYASRALSIPHPEFRKRAFVLAPAVNIAPDWRDPVTGLTLRHLNARLTSAQPLPR